MKRERGFGDFHLIKSGLLLFECSHIHYTFFVCSNFQCNFMVDDNAANENC